MSIRRLGPVLAAGVVVVEKTAARPIEQAPLGVTCYFGVLEKGDTDKLIPTNGPNDLFRKVGTRLDDTSRVCPDAAEDFWEHSQGAGELWLIRITDGNERKSEYTFWNRAETGLYSKVLKVEAHNGGRWGGKKNSLWGEMVGSGDLTNTTLDTGTTMLEDEWAGGVIVLDEIPTYSFTIVSNTTAGVLTVESDATMKDLWTASGGGDLGYFLKLVNDGKALGVKILEGGEDDPTNEYGLEVYVDGDLVVTFPNCNQDPSEKNNVEAVVNENDSQWEILVDMLWSGGFTDQTRPANAFGEVDTVVANVLTLVLFQSLVASPGGADPTITISGATNDDMVAQQLVGTVDAPATGIDWVSDKFGAIGPLHTIGGAWGPDCPYVPNFSVVNGGTALAAGDIITIDYRPLEADALIGGDLFPNYIDTKKLSYLITDNDHKSITVDPSIDLTAVTAIAKRWMASYITELEGGYDGIAQIADTDFTTAMNPATTLIKQFMGKNKGLIKLAAPGETATLVQKAGATLADAFWYQWRYEIPAATTDEDSAISHIDNTLGRNDFAVNTFPSFAKVRVPELVALKTISQTGAIHGREALVARNYEGFHKAGSDITVTLPRIVELPTGDTVLNEEKLNPRGIGIIKKAHGNFIVWGDRTVALDPAWKWKHQREMMSHYEHVLMENFDWIIFAINDPVEQINAASALKSYFFPEWRKRALRGDKFEDAAVIKVDNEINTDATRAAGDMLAEVELSLADTIERFKITMSKAGFTETSA